LKCFVSKEPSLLAKVHYESRLSLRLLACHTAGHVGNKKSAVGFPSKGPQLVRTPRYVRTWYPAYPVQVLRTAKKNIRPFQTRNLPVFLARRTRVAIILLSRRQGPFEASDCGRLGRQAAGHPWSALHVVKSCRKDCRNSFGAARSQSSSSASGTVPDLTI